MLQYLARVMDKIPLFLCNVIEYALFLVAPLDILLVNKFVNALLDLGDGRREPSFGLLDNFVYQQLVGKLLACLHDTHNRGLWNKLLLSPRLPAEIVAPSKTRHQHCIIPDMLIPHPSLSITLFFCTFNFLAPH